MGCDVLEVWTFSRNPDLLHGRSCGDDYRLELRELRFGPIRRYQVAVIGLPEMTEITIRDRNTRHSARQAGKEMALAVSGYLGPDMPMVKKELQK